MFNFSMSELIIILVIALVVFGPAKLPEIGKAIGKSMRDFKEAASGTDSKEHKS
ncbi:twin-arginine translocase TatA/TatE family subunit [Azotosporobacter soli]|uniref:twin-arginine translocase TatA/TatE family subunit n=1 Tax=Azotosporobacter soli TaxID=3055040 RepID=UPI0031FE7F62